MYGCDVIVGCQFGSEGKGLVAGAVANLFDYQGLISVNSAQAGHTIYWEGKKHVLRHLPAAAVVNKKAKIYIGAGTIINLDVFLKEIKEVESKGVPIKNRLVINQMATIIEPEDIEAEENSSIVNRIGSTAEGVGVALAKRVNRVAKTVFDYMHKFDPELNVMFTLKSAEEFFTSNEYCLLEGSQGYGLSNFGEFYPFCTGRGTTTAFMIGYAGIPPTKVRRVFGIFRSYPIRVGGNSGPLYNELSWHEINDRSGYLERDVDLTEVTTVTKRVRRIGEWNQELAEKAFNDNGVTHPVLTFANYLDADFVENQAKFSQHKLAELLPWWAISFSEQYELAIIGNNML